MSLVLEHKTRRHKTRPGEIRLSLGYLKSAIEANVIYGEIHKATWSDWCRRFLKKGNATADREVDISIAAGLFTVAGMHAYGCRSYKGPKYDRLYQESLKHMKDICNVE